MQWMALGNLGFFLIVPAIVALYLLKRKVEDIEVPSTLLWQRTLQSWEAVRPWEKLQRNLLLLLQLLAALLLVLALIRPAIPVAGAIAEHSILVVDTSGSMLTRESGPDGEKTRFQRAITEVRSIVEELGSGQAVTLIEAGREPKIWLSRSTDKQAILETLDSLAPRPGTADQRAALSLAGAIAATEEGSGVMWFGDGGSEGQEQGGPVSISGPFRFYQMGQTKENVAIGAFVTQAGAGNTEGLLRIDNHGSQSQKGTISIFGLDQELVDVGTFSVEGGSSQTVTFERLPSKPAYRAVIEAEEDGLAEDNESWSVPYASGKGRAVLVSPQSNRFLHQALQTVGHVEVETETALPTAKSGAADLWIFDGVVPEKLPEGNILLIAPNQKTDWLPYQGVAEVTGKPEATQADDPVMKHVDLRDVHVVKTAVWGAVPGLRALAKAGETDLIAAGTVSGRKVLVIGFDLHDSDLPLRPAFPILMQNAVSWLSSAQAVPIGPALPGEALSISLTPGASKRVLTLPDGKTEVLDVKGTTWLYQVPEQTGLCRLTEETGGQGSATVRYFAVQMSDAESLITPRPLSVAGGRGRSSSEEMGGNEESQSKEGSTAGRSLPLNGARELTYWIAALALLAVFVEWRVYRRGY
ncbi:VWA domain-containing protein [Brevibacillus ruminantium]|uniref:VWA domain-containing protein n=1 Tax=Brevibacillus ruminantium TaxID=2950604 RepID=A0ABY4WHW9_9BACL|nr:BatA and WFA domain-containing protein [Brevibacillus ruminantium]USG64939.1 VWA domain-containing protein [Brevibacillus ruminantium]